MTPSVGKAILEPFKRFFLCASHVANWLRWSRRSGDTSTHSGHLTTKKKSMKEREWGRAKKGGEIYKWINQWTPSPASQTSPHPSPSWTPQMCVCAADKRWKTNWSSTTPTAFGRKMKKKKKWWHLHAVITGGRPGRTGSRPLCRWPTRVLLRNYPLK